MINVVRIYSDTRETGYYVKITVSEIKSQVALNVVQLLV